MSSKLVGAICICILIVSAGICSIGYAVGNSGFPWWLIIVGGGIISAILAMAGTASREEDKEKKHMRIISCICASISMISVFVFLILMLVANIPNSWIAVFVGGILSGIIYIMDGALKKEKEEKKK